MSNERDITARTDRDLSTQDLLAEERAIKRAEAHEARIALAKERGYIDGLATPPRTWLHITRRGEYDAVQLGEGKIKLMARKAHNPKDGEFAGREVMVHQMEGLRTVDGNWTGSKSSEEK